ncbi:ATP-binding protein [Citrobacter koseri]|uniref:ATP-binding protein n=1 Tax=Citrobacter koseri TaxID=545 RepID=UPI001F300842|nr:ATP-binding protein [Citrobacter koseri]
MRQQHLAGEKCFIDYCGPTVPVIQAETGEYRQAQSFVERSENVILLGPPGVGKTHLWGITRWSMPSWTA